MTEMVLCPERPFPALSACVREEGHDGRCVFARGTERGDAITFYEATPRGAGFKAIVHADLEEDGTRVARKGAAVMWAMLDAAKS